MTNKTLLHLVITHGNEYLRIVDHTNIGIQHAIILIFLISKLSVAKHLPLFDVNNKHILKYIYCTINLSNVKTFK